MQNITYVPFVLTLLEVVGAPQFYEYMILKFSKRAPKGLNRQNHDLTLQKERKKWRTLMNLKAVFLVLQFF